MNLSSCVVVGYHISSVRCASCITNWRADWIVCLICTITTTLCHSFMIPIPQCQICDPEFLRSQIIFFLFASVLIEIPVIRRISIIFILEPFGVILELQNITQWVKRNKIEGDSDVRDPCHSFRCSFLRCFGAPSSSSTLLVPLLSCPFVSSSIWQKIRALLALD